MVLPEALLVSIKQRASDLGLSTTAYITQLVRRDLGLPEVAGGVIWERLMELEQRVSNLEGPGPQAGL